MNRRRRNKPELLLPAGSVDSLKSAVRFGADAVYLGTGGLSLRAGSSDLSEQELEEACIFSHSNNVRVYLAVNIFATDEDVDKAAVLFDRLSGTRADRRPDAFIISDPGVFQTAVKHCPDIPVHISTQANTLSSASVMFWYEKGVRRVVLARELSLSRIKKLRDLVPDDMELECFVHGAMCVSYSGRCLLSRAMTGRDANHGECAHPCRYRYALVEEMRPGEYYPIEEDDRGTTVLASEDLCMAGHIDELLDAGIDSFKIEGRMKNALYVASVARVYRCALDLAAADPEGYTARKDSLAHELAKISDRPSSTGFYFSDGTVTDLPEAAKSDVRRIFFGPVRQKGRLAEDGTLKVVVEQKNRFFTGDSVRFIEPGIPGEAELDAVILKIEDAEGNEVRSAPHPKQLLTVTLRTEGNINSRIPEEGDIMSGEAARETKGG